MEPHRETRYDPPSTSELYHFPGEITSTGHFYAQKEDDIMAKAKKLPSGAWRVQVLDYIDLYGKKHRKSFTASTKKEAELIASQYYCNRPTTVRQEFTVKEGMDIYISSREGVISPSTIRCYRLNFKNHMKAIQDMQIRKIRNEDLQRWIQDLSTGRSPKTVRNVYGQFISMVNTLYPDLHFRVVLPQRKGSNLYVPTDSDVRALIEEFKSYDRNMLIACCLAAYGTLRRSEICALDASDVSGNVIHVHAAMVLDENNNWITKVPKTKSSDRYIDLPDFVIDLLPSEGKIVKINPNELTQRFINTISRLKIPKFRFHDLRHYSASVMHAIGVPDVYIMQRGGWSSDATLKNIYRGSMDDFQKKFTNITNSHFEKINKSSHESSHEIKKPQ